MLKQQTEETAARLEEALQSELLEMAKQLAQAIRLRALHPKGQVAVGSALSKLKETLDRILEGREEITTGSTGDDRRAAVAKAIRQICEALAGLDKEKKDAGLSVLKEILQGMDPGIVLKLIEDQDVGADDGGSSGDEDGSELVLELTESLSVGAKMGVLAALVRSKRNDSRRISSVFGIIAGAKKRRRGLLGTLGKQADTPAKAGEAGIESIWGAVQDLVLSESEERFVESEYASMLETLGEESGRKNESLAENHSRIDRLRQTLEPVHIQIGKARFLLDLAALQNDIGKLKVTMSGLESACAALIEMGSAADAAIVVREFAEFLKERGNRGTEIDDVLHGCLRSLPNDSTASTVLDNMAHTGGGGGSLPSALPGHQSTPEEDSIREFIRTSATTMSSIYSESVEGGTDLESAKTILSDIKDLLSSDTSKLQYLLGIKSHDDYTYTHIVNVCVLTLAQARRLNLSEEVLDDIGLAALMHDVGKQKVPGEIIRKPSRLTSQEFELMKMHTVYGAEMIQEMPGAPALAAMVAFEHHLKYDCTGYPSIRARRRLNLCTYLTTIADAFDAMRTMRPYSKRMSREEVAVRMAKDAGTHFEPVLLSRFFRMLDVFPRGSNVVLSTGEVALVVKRNPEDYIRPVVRVTADSHGKEICEGRTIDLMRHSGPERISISEVIEPEIEEQSNSAAA